MPQAPTTARSTAYSPTKHVREHYRVNEFDLSDGLVGHCPFVVDTRPNTPLGRLLVTSELHPTALGPITRPKLPDFPPDQLFLGAGNRRGSP
ncbi:hypothetical protein GCM10027444_43560 [Actinopolyspora lacussalsi]